MFKENKQQEKKRKYTAGSRWQELKKQRKVDSEAKLGK